MTTLILNSTLDDLDFELLSKRKKLLTTLMVDFASIDDDIDFELFSKKQKNLIDIWFYPHR
jgi:hypothetical protein